MDDDGEDRRGVGGLAGEARGPGHAEDDGVHVLEVARVGGEPHVQFDLVLRDLRPASDMVLDVAGAVLRERGHDAARGLLLEFGHDRLVGQSHDVGQHVQTPAVRHPHEHLSRPAPPRAPDDPAHHRHEHVESLYGEALLPEVGAVQERLESLHAGQPLEARLRPLAAHQEPVAVRLDVVHEPVALGRVLHLVEFVADRAAVDLLEAVHDLGGVVAEVLEPDGGSGHAREFVAADAVIFRFQQRVPRRLGAERVDARPEVSVRAVGLDEGPGDGGEPQVLRRHDLRLGGRGCGRGRSGGRRRDDGPRWRFEDRLRRWVPARQRRRDHTPVA